MNGRRSIVTRGASHHAVPSKGSGGVEYEVGDQVSKCTGFDAYDIVIHL